MMLRYICQETDIGAAFNIGGPVDVFHRTFTDPVELERWLRYGDWPAGQSSQYNARRVLGVEVVNPDPGDSEEVTP